MAKAHRKFTDEFRREAVRFLEETGRSVPEVARELKIPEAVLYRWRSKYGTGHSAAPLTATEAEELRRLRRENEVLRQERDFLKKAAAYFANRPS